MSNQSIRPKPTAGLRHVALFVAQFEACEQFYVELMGMQVEWRPDPDNLYLSSGNDNLALHRADDVDMSGFQRLDHIGFIIDDIDQVELDYIEPIQALDRFGLCFFFGVLGWISDPPQKAS